MVTANNVNKLFKDRSIMSDSFVERYIRAKKRNPVRPKCLFGRPHGSETEKFLLQHEHQQMQDTRDVYEKYDLSAIPDGSEKDNLFPVFETPSTSEESMENIEADCSLTTFRPKIVTEDDPPPCDNLFSPIEKPESAPAADDADVDNWRTSKRRRSSSILVSEQVPESKEDQATTSKGA